MIEELKRAQQHAEAGPRHTVLRLWRAGIEVEVYCAGERWTRRVTWHEIQHAHGNPIILAIDDCNSFCDMQTLHMAKTSGRSEE